MGEFSLSLLPQNCYIVSETCRNYLLRSPSLPRVFSEVVFLAVYAWKWCLDIFVPKSDSLGWEMKGLQTWKKKRKDYASL